MYLDAQTLLSDAQAFSADATSTNTFDSGLATNDISIGEPMGIGISVDVAADFTTGDETYEFQAIQSANANLTSPDILAARTIAAANLTAGSFHVLPIPPGSKTKQYLGLYFNGGGTTPTVTVTAWIAPLSMLAKHKNYPDALTIS